MVRRSTVSVNGAGERRRRGATDPPVLTVHLPLRRRGQQPRLRFSTLLQAKAAFKEMRYASVAKAFRRRCFSPANRPKLNKPANNMLSDPGSGALTTLPTP
jgi:hypothetical protein